MRDCCAEYCLQFGEALVDTVVFCYACRAILDIIEAMPRPKQDTSTLILNVGKLLGYLQLNERYLVPYAGLPISSATAESAVNELVSMRMAKRRQMRWSEEALISLSRFVPQFSTGRCGLERSQRHGLAILETRGAMSTASGRWRLRSQELPHFCMLPLTATEEGEVGRTRFHERLCPIPTHTPRICRVGA